MTERRFDVVRLDELEPALVWRGSARLPVREHFDVRAFGVNAYRAESEGVPVIEEHDEASTPGAANHQELYVVLTGHAVFTVDREEIDAPAGTIVFARDPAARRGAVAREAGTTVLVVGATPGQAFEPSRWERMAPAMRFWTTGEFDRAAEALHGLHEEDPENGLVLFNLACAEVRLGRHDDALEHLERAVALDPELRENAATDDDLAPLREDPRFAALART
jgi:hypothetical protein